MVTFSIVRNPEKPMIKEDGNLDTCAICQEPITFLADEDDDGEPMMRLVHLITDPDLRREAVRKHIDFIEETEDND